MGEEEGVRFPSLAVVSSPIGLVCVCACCACMCVYEWCVYVHVCLCVHTCSF